MPPSAPLPPRAASAPGYRTKSTKRSAQELESPAANAAPANAGTSASDVQTQRVPLQSLIQEAVKRWFEDTLQEAQRGDVKQQALLGQMYAEGYGCAKNPKAAKEWADKAAARGYKMQGVYCEL